MAVQNIQPYSDYFFASRQGGNLAGRVGFGPIKASPAPQPLLRVQTLQFQFESLTFSRKEVGDQGQVFESFSAVRGEIADFEIDLRQAGQPGNGQASSLFDGDGYWGVGQTADRIAGFVINGAGDDINKLHQGREGILRGFKEAEQIWGGQLPEISYKTIEKALEKIDSRIHQLGAPVIDVAA